MPLAQRFLPPVSVKSCDGELISPLKGSLGDSPASFQAAGLLSLDFRGKTRCPCRFAVRDCPSLTVPLPIRPTHLWLCVWDTGIPRYIIKHSSSFIVNEMKLRFRHFSKCVLFRSNRRQASQELPGIHDFAAQRSQCLLESTFHNHFAREKNSPTFDNHRRFVWETKKEEQIKEIEVSIVTTAACCWIAVGISEGFTDSTWKENSDKTILQSTHLHGKERVFRVFIFITFFLSLHNILFLVYESSGAYSLSQTSTPSFFF